MHSVDQFLMDMDIVILVTRGLLEQDVPLQHVQEAKAILDSMCEGDEAELAVRSKCQTTLRRNLHAALRQYRSDRKGDVELDSLAVIQSSLLLQLEVLPS